MFLARPRKSRPALLLALVCAGGALLVPLAPAQDNAALIERARLANDSRQFAQARSDLAVVLARSPWNEGALLEQARLLYFERNHEDAWKTVTALLGEYPRNASALNLRALLNFEFKKDPEAALADLTSAVQHDPKLAKAFMNRARILRTLKRPAEALEDVDAAIELEPENGAFRWTRGLIFFELKQTPRALENFNDAIDLMPDDAEMRIRRATLIHSRWTPNTQAETYGAVKADVERALELVPGHPEALLLRGYCLEFEENPAAAFDSYFEAYRKLPNDNRVWQALQKTCRTQFEPGRDPARVYQLLDDAKAAFVRSNYDPDQGRHLEAVFDFIPFKVASTDPARLRNKDYLESLLRSNPGNLRLLYHVHAGVIGQEAEQAMRSIVRDFDPAKDKIFGVLAAIQVSRILQTRGDSQPNQEGSRLYKEAGEWLEKVVQIDPTTDRFKPAVEQYNRRVKDFKAERAAATKAITDMVEQYNRLSSRFVQARDHIASTDAIAAQHLQRSMQILRSSRTANQGDLNRATAYKQQAFAAKKSGMAGVKELYKELDDFRYRFPNASKEHKDWTIEARNYLGKKMSEFGAMEREMKQ